MSLKGRVREHRFYFRRHRKRTVDRVVAEAVIQGGVEVVEGVEVAMVETKIRFNELSRHISKRKKDGRY